jgi:hypothetical protein
MVRTALPDAAASCENFVQRSGELWRFLIGVIVAPRWRKRGSGRPLLETARSWPAHSRAPQRQVKDGSTPKRGLLDAGATH